MRTFFQSLKLRKLISFGALTLAATAASGAVTYVATNGNDANSCASALNPATPKRTIPAAFNCLNSSVGAGANQTIEVAAGTYTETLDENVGALLWPSGSSWSAPFTLRSRAGDLVTIKSSAEINIRIMSMRSLFAVIDGFQLDGSNQPAMSYQIFIGSCCDAPSEIRFRNLEIIHTEGCMAVYVGSWSNHVDFSDSKIHGGAFSCPGWGGDYGYPFYYTGSNGIIENVEMYDIPAFGIHLYSQHLPPPANNIVRRNRVHDFALKRHSAAGILLGTGDGHMAYDNIVYNGPGGDGDGGVGMAVSGSNCKVYNNTIYNNSWIGIDAAGSVNAIVRNNISFQNGQNTDFTGANGGPFPVNLQQSNNLTIDPQFVNALAGDFHLLASSPAIDAGVNLSEITYDFAGAPRPQGARTDIGAYEFGGVTATTDSIAPVVSIVSPANGSIVLLRN